jgi:hypothetical protein
MNKLTEKEERFLNIIEEDDVSRRYSFQKLKGIKWFDHLKERDFLKPEKNPSPIKSDGDLYTVPTWDVLNYLLNTLQSEDEINKEYKHKYLNFIEEVTKKTKPENSNYRTWWMFAQMLPYLTDQITSNFISKNIPFWLEDRFTTSITVKELSEKLFPKLIEVGKKEAALSLLRSIIRVEKKEKSTELDKYQFTADQYWVKNFLVKQYKDISKLGTEALEVLENELLTILTADDRKQDKTAFIWRPAIEDHEQNPDYGTKAKMVLVSGLRDIIYEMESNEEEVDEYLDRCFKLEFIVLKRLGIHHMNATWPKYKSKASQLINEKYLNSYFIHELYGLLKSRFNEFEPKLQKAFLDYVDSLDNYSDKKYKEQQIAHSKLNWLTAVKESKNARAKKLYKENLTIAGEEPEHPDFPFYSRSGFVADRSKYTVEDLASFKTQDLIKTLNEFEEDRRQFEGPTKRGLANTFRSYLATLQEDQEKTIGQFIELDDMYLSEVVQFLEKNIQDDGRYELTKALQFCEKIIEEKPELFEIEYSATLDSINRFLREVTRNDELFENSNDLRLVYEIIDVQLKKINENRSGVEGTKDYLTKAINTQKGKVLEALINYSLLICRLADKEKDSHEKEWGDLESLYDTLINEKYDYVTASIFSRYLPNLIYLDKKWVQKSLKTVFNPQDQETWLAAVAGHAYGKYVGSVMDFLVNDGQLKLILEAFENEEIEFQTYRRFIQFSAIHFLLNDGSDAIAPMLERSKDAELSELASSVRYLRDNLHDDFIPRVFELWRLLLKHIQRHEKDFTNTLSGLSKWVVFIDSFENDEYKLLEQVMPFAFKPNHFDFFLDEWIRLVKIDPEKTADLLLMALKEKVPYLEKEKMIEFVDYLLKSGLREKAEEISNILFENGSVFVTDHLQSNK